jgi:MFS family permease
MNVDHTKRTDLSLLIACGCIVAVITFGARSGFGLYLEPMTSTFGWGREVFALALAIQQIVWGAGQPIAGGFADRYGVTPVLIIGTLIYATGFALMSVSSEPWMLYLSTGVLIGIGGAAASFAIIMAAVGRMVSEERRSWALGLVVACSSLGMFVYAPMGQAFITSFGWPTALLLTASSVLLVIPLSLPYLGDRGTAASGGQTIGQALREAAGHRSYWLLVAGFFVCGYHVAFIQVHLPAYVADQGGAAWVGGWALALIGLFNVVGSYTAGVLGGRRSKKNLLCLIYLARAVVIAVYVSVPTSAASTLVFAALMGLLWLSTVPPTSGLIALMFGPRYMATLFGVVFFSHQMGAFLGVLAALVHWPISERAVPRPAPAAA